MGTRIETSIVINASMEQVWGILTNFNDYQQWNPFIRSIAEPVQENRLTRVVITPPDGGSFTFKPLVLRYRPYELRWVGKLLIKGLFDGEHYFRIEAQGPSQVIFYHGEEFSGLLVKLMPGMLEKTRKGFESMNQALKAKAEASTNR